MDTYVMTEAERQLADIIWDAEPLQSRTLVELCNQKLDWKKSTTYTVLKKLCENQLFQNVDSVVTSMVGREEYKRRIGENYLNHNYSGSLPSFVAAFADSGRLSKEDIEELSQLIEKYREA